MGMRCLYRILFRIRSRILFAPACLIMLAGVSCSTTDAEPEYGALVHVEVDLLTDGHDLQSPLGYLSIPAPRVSGELTGMGGIVIVHGIDHAHGTGYYAYDLACPYEKKRDIRISPTPASEQGLLLFKCKGCGRVYELATGDGSAVNRNEPIRLIRYRVTLNGEKLYITN